MNHESMDSKTREIAEPLLQHWKEYLEVRQRPVGAMIFNGYSVLNGFTRYLERVAEDMEDE